MSGGRSVFHAGEREVQRRRGVADAAEAVGRIVAATISPAVGRVLSTQRMAVATTLDTAGRPWTSLLEGPAGFLRRVDENLLQIDRLPRPDDPLAANLAARPDLGLLVLDPPTRRRIRLNGRALVREDGIFLLADQVYGNCPKYIQARRLVAAVPPADAGPARSSTLDARQRRWIEAADTFFIGSFHPEGGADASHRGGRPGFVRVYDERRLAFPDYPGNNMFNTLGNLRAYPRAGLLFVDFASGGLLHLTGSTLLRVEDDPAEVQFLVEEAVERPGASSLRWELVEPWAGNPLVTAGRGRHLKPVKEER